MWSALVANELIGSRLAHVLARLRIDVPFNRSTSFAVDILFFDWLAIPLTRAAAKVKGLTPNMVTGLSAAIGLGAGGLFSQQQFLWGSLAMYLSMLLDCVDGDLARLTGTTSEFGAKLDATADTLKKAVALIALTWVTDWPVVLVVVLIVAHYVLLRALPSGPTATHREARAANYSLEPVPEPYDLMVVLLWLGPLIHFEVVLTGVVLVQLVLGFARRRP